MTKKPSLKAHVELHKKEGSEAEVGIMVTSRDGTPLTGNQILEAVAEALLIYWDNYPLESREYEEFDA